jgi:hypothetical protein
MVTTTKYRKSLTNTVQLKQLFWRPEIKGRIIGKCVAERQKQTACIKCSGQVTVRID